MKPLFTYKIPDSPHWYIVITDTSHHFYFNNHDKSSYWQLSDIQEHYKNDIDIVKRLIKSINFDELAILFAKSRGVKFEKIEDELESIEVDHSKEEVQPKQTEQQQVTEEEEIVVVENIPSKVTKAKPKEEKQPLTKQINSIIQGYLSSDDEEDEEEEVNSKETKQESSQTINIDELTSQALAQHQKSTEIESDDDDDNDNGSLDLSLSETEDAATASTSSAEQDFINLLNQFSNRISIYESWDLVEEELLPEFTTYPEFFAISSKLERQKLFQKWCTQQEQQQQEPKSPQTTINEGAFPTVKLNYLIFLQDFKQDIKQSFYQSFYNSHYQKLNEFNLSSQMKETIFRNYKIMLNDFTKFAKNYKKSNVGDNRNLKVMKLNEFLQNKLHSHITNTADSGPFNVDSNLSDLDNWINLLNHYDIPTDIAENEINFLVGDEKRLNSYIDQLKPTK